LNFISILELKFNRNIIRFCKVVMVVYSLRFMFEVGCANHLSLQVGRLRLAACNLRLILRHCSYFTKEGNPELLGGNLLSTGENYPNSTYTSL
jgi:hypothetical protein